MTLKLTYCQTWYELHNLLQDCGNLDLIGPCRDLHQVMNPQQDASGPVLMTLLFHSLPRPYMPLTLQAIFDCIANLTLRSPDPNVDHILSIQGMYHSLQLSNPRVACLGPHLTGHISTLSGYAQAFFDLWNAGTYTYVYPEAVLFASLSTSLFDVENWLRGETPVIPWSQVDPCGVLEDIAFFRPRLDAEINWGDAPPPVDLD